MIDINLIPATDVAYTAAPPGGALNDAAPVDPAFATPDAALTVFGLGGEYGPGRVNVASGPDEGGAPITADDVVTTVPPAPEPKPGYAMTGRSWNATTRLNLYPWFKTPREGLDQNNPPPAPAGTQEPLPEPPPPSGIEVDPPLIENGVGTVVFHGPAQRDASVELAILVAGAFTTVTIAITAGMTASQIAAAVRSHINENADGLSAAGTGGSVIIEPVNESDEVDEIVVNVA